MKKWKCSVCGYVHVGDEPPEKCPVCGADRSMFKEIVEESPASSDAETASALGADAADTSSGAATSVASQDAAAPETSSEPLAPSSFRTTFLKYYEITTRLMVKYHAHPIAVHIPNGVLPVAFIFLILSIMFQSRGLEIAAFYNLVIVVLAMPKVVFSGYNDWKHRFAGHMTNVFLTKIICGCAVFGLGAILVIWRLINPEIIFSTTGFRWIYVLIYMLMLAAVTIAGFLGGKLIRFPGD